MDAPKHAPVKQIVKYRRKADVHKAVTSALDGRVKPNEVVKSDNPVEVKRGPKPVVVRDFNNDPRSMDMAVYIGQGLTVEEAGILAKFSPEEMKQLSERSESYRRWLELQVIKFKQKHLKVISEKDNASTSQWLLEQKFPEQFGKKATAGSGGVGSTQIIQAIVKSVQMNTDEPVVIHEHSNKKEKSQGHHIERLGEGHQPSLEPGGANIL